MNAKIVLREVAATAQHLAGLHEITGCAHASVQREPIALGAFKLKADPVIRASLPAAGS